MTSRGQSGSQSKDEHDLGLVHFMHATRSTATREDAKLLVRHADKKISNTSFSSSSHAEPISILAKCLDVPNLSEYLKGQPGESSVTDLTMDTNDAHQRTTMCITRTAKEFEHDVISDGGNGAMKSKNVGREYTIDPVLRHLGKVANTR